MSKLLFGRVISNKMNKTIVVEVVRRVRHKVYMKIVSNFSRFFVHDEKNECLDGDFIFFENVIPLSKKKHWKLVRILGR